MTKPQTKDGRCAHCSVDTNMVLAKDSTTYSPCEVVGGKWFTTYRDVQPSQGDDGIRFFCSDCGTQHAVPTELVD